MNDPTQRTLSEHQVVWESLPWIVNGRASDADRRAVEAHLVSCEDCRDELAFQRRIQRTISDEPSSLIELNPQEALQQLWKQIDSVAVPHRSVQRPRHRRIPSRFRRSFRMGYRLAVMVLIVETIALGVLGTREWGHTPAHVLGYQTLSAPAPNAPGAIVRLVPSPTLRIEQLQTLLQLLDLQVVSGPSEAGVYSLALNDGVVAPPTTATILAQLRANPGIRFAEPVDAPQKH